MSDAAHWRASLRLSPATRIFPPTAQKVTAQHTKAAPSEILEVLEEYYNHSGRQNALISKCISVIRKTLSPQVAQGCPEMHQRQRAIESTGFEHTADFATLPPCSIDRRHSSCVKPNICRCLFMSGTQHCICVVITGGLITSSRNDRNC